MLPVPARRVQAVPAVLAEDEGGMSTQYRKLSYDEKVRARAAARIAPPEDIYGDAWAGEEARNGLPPFTPYVRHAGDAARDAEVAAIVAAAQARADAMPGAIARCARCRKPAAECGCGDGAA
jgi:hypothetical protein